VTRVILRNSAIMFISIVAAGCVERDISDLESRITQIKARPAGQITAVREFKSYQSFSYEGEHLREPFSPAKKFEAEIVEDTSPATADLGGLQPNRTRHKESLEVFPLDTLRYVGLLERAEERWAIVVSPDQLIHKVKVNNYMGTNQGLIVDISESTIEMVELVANGMGGWLERKAVLTLGE
jgi:type IV pilus assembly protein PilP